MTDLRTPRLHLMAATLEMAHAEVHSRSALTKLLEARLPDDWPPPFNDDDSARFVLNYLTRHPAAVGWMAWYFILTDGVERTVIGNGGFKGEPFGGAVEIGYSIVPRYQRRGLGTEAVRALLDWAFTHDGVRRIVAQTMPELRASQTLLDKLGFRQAASADPGVLRFELEAPSASTGL